MLLTISLKDIPRRSLECNAIFLEPRLGLVRKTPCMSGWAQRALPQLIALSRTGRQRTQASSEPMLVSSVTQLLATFRFSFTRM